MVRALAGGSAAGASLMQPTGSERCAPQEGRVISHVLWLLARCSHVSCTGGGRRASGRDQKRGAESFRDPDLSLLNRIDCC